MAQFAFLLCSKPFWPLFLHLFFSRNLVFFPDFLFSVPSPCFPSPLISLSFYSIPHLLPCFFTPTLFPAVISVFLSFVLSDLLLSELSTWWDVRDTDTHGGKRILHGGTQSFISTHARTHTVNFKYWAQRSFKTIHNHTHNTHKHRHCHTMWLYQEEDCFQDESLYTVYVSVPLL